MNILKKIASTMLATSMCFSAMSGFNMITSSAETDDEPIKILSVGDSITDGYWESGSYRKYMYNYLVEDGFNIDMVGNRGMNEETYNAISYDGNYCAYSGYAIQYITGTETRQGIYEVLVDESIMENYSPDIVLLQIGTNDILSAYNEGIIDRLENLADYIISYMKDEEDTLFITTIPDFDVSVLNDAGWLWAYGWGVSSDELSTTIQGYIDSYNSQIKDLVLKKQSEGCTHIQFADINSVVDYSTDLYDGVHPNESGYEKMGKYWAEVLTSYLNDNGDVVTGNPIEVTTTTEVTTTEITTTEITTTDTVTDTTTEVTTPTDVTTISTTETPTEVTTTEIVPNITKGDVNQDGSIDMIDLLMVKKHLLGLTSIDDSSVQYVDINNNDTIDIIDYINLKGTIILIEE